MLIFMTALAVVLVIAFGIMAISWYGRHVDVLTLIRFMEKQGYRKPTERELKECRDEVFANFRK